MALQRQERVVGRHATPVVDHAHERQPALLHVDLHLPSAGIEGVLDELLHDRGGALHHLACGDLVHEPGREYLDAGHGAL